MEGIRDGNARHAAETYIGDRCTQQSTGVADGVEGFVAFFEQFIARTRKRDIRIVRSIEGGNHVFVHAYQNLDDGDWAARVIDQELEAEPGQRFEYSTGTTAVLAEIVADQVGGPDALEDSMRSELLDPLGIESTTFVEDSTGQFAGGLGFDSTIRDFDRFGYLFLRGGEWDGDQLLSTDWIDYSAAASPASPEYAAQWWLDGPDGNLIARGPFGQYILLVPEHDRVIVATATQGGDSWTPLVTLYEQFDSSL